MSLNVPTEIGEMIVGARAEVVTHEVFVRICRDSLPGAVRMYEVLHSRLSLAQTPSYKKCFHGFTDVERGHVIRACYGDAINRELNRHFGIVLVRLSSGRVAGFQPSAAKGSEFRRKVFELSSQTAHADDPVETSPIIDHPDTLREIEHLYPLAYASIARHEGRPFADLDSKPQPLFGQMVEMLSIRPYRYLLEDAFGEIATVNCCGDVGRGKKKPPRNPDGQQEDEDDEDVDEKLFAFRQTRTFQLQMQEPYLADC